DVLRQLLPWRIEREAERPGEAVHDATVPGIGIVFESLAHKTAAPDAPPRVGHQQFRMGQLVDAEASAGAAGALRSIESEKLALDVAIDETMRSAAKPTIEARGLGTPAGATTGALRHLHLQQAVADQQRGGDAGLDRFFMLAADDEAIDHGVHVPDGGFVELDFGGNVDRLAVTDQA